MKKRALAAFSAAILALGLLAVPVSAHHPYTPYSHYAGDCDDNAGHSPSFNQIPHVQRNVGQVGDTFDAAQSIATYQPMYPCSSWVWSTNHGVTLVNGVNLQDDTTGRLIQLGWAQYDCSTQYCNNFPERQTRFWYSQSETNQVIWAADWVDLDNNGQQDNLVIGRNYQFYIGATVFADGRWMWRLQVNDLTTGAYDVKYIPRTIPSVDTVWYGFETYNSGTVLGRTAGSSRINIRGMRYSTLGDGGWSSYLSPDFQCGWAGYNGGDFDPDWANCTIGYDPTYGMVLDAHTTYHE